MMEETKRGRKFGSPNHTENAIKISKLKWIREMRGYSQTSLASATGNSTRTIRAFESGYRNINLAEANTVYRLATVLGVKMEELLDV